MNSLRRARPLLGTLVEIGARGVRASQASIDTAFAAIGEVQSQLSRFDPRSDIGRFNASPRGTRIKVGVHAATVLSAARELHDASSGLFDVSLGSGPCAWQLDATTLIKCHDGVRLDLGGIAKGHAVDLAIEVLRSNGCEAGWVNAGGDLRVFGDAPMPLDLRDEINGGVRRFGVLRDGAFATSHFGEGARSRAVDSPWPVHGHVSVVAPRCLWADALTKVVAISGNARHSLLLRWEASAWLH